jgi:hypothetical protein
MPKAWSAKDERMYEHVKESEKGTGRAKEIAARTVNKKRKEEGRTASARSEAKPARKGSASRSSARRGRAITSGRGRKARGRG